jgi:small subunit ribosomal protein S6
MGLTSGSMSVKKIFCLFLLVPFDLAERDQTFPNREDVRKERGRMRQYETIYIVNPNLGEEEYREVMKRYNNLIEKNKGVIVKTEEWGVQRLAYDLKKLDKGSYVLTNFCGDPGLTAELERDLKLDDRILKFQTIKLADEVDPQELLQKEKEARRETVVTQEQPPETPKAAAEEKTEEAKGEEKGDA